MQPLCTELGVTIAELMDGEAGDAASTHAYDEQHLLELLERVQNLESHRNLVVGLLLICMGIALLVLSHLVGDTGVRATVSGVLLGISIGEMLVGVYVVARSMARG